MSLRRIARSTVVLVHGVAHEARVYRDSEWNEYRVRIYSDGKLNAEADYHCTDNQEAHDQMQSYESGWLKAATAPRPMHPETLRYLLSLQAIAAHRQFQGMAMQGNERRALHASDANYYREQAIIAQESARIAFQRIASVRGLFD